MKKVNFINNHLEEAEYWNTIRACKHQQIKEQVEYLCHYYENDDFFKIFDFDFHTAYFASTIYTKELYCAYELIIHGRDISFEDFIYFLISKGEEIYTMARMYPDDLYDYLEHFEYWESTYSAPEFKTMGKLVYNFKTGGGDYYYEENFDRSESIFEEWELIELDVENLDVENTCPKLFKYFSAIKEKEM